MSRIEFVNYPGLYDYAILAQAGITSAATVTVTDGYYGTNSASTDSTGVFVPARGVPSTTTPLAGENNQPLAAAATAELGNVSSAAGTLVKDVINTAASFGAQTPITGLTGFITLLPNTYYYSAGALTFGSGGFPPLPTLIKFDTQGDPNAQFFILSGANITFTDVNIDLYGDTLVPASPANIFWLAETASITFNGIMPIVYGNIISAAGVTFNQTFSSLVNGNIFAFGASVTFAADTTVNGQGSYLPVPVVCYAKGTQILTKEGYTLIEDLNVDDKIITKGKIYKNEKYIHDKFRVEPIYWISKFKARNLTTDSAPICIKANAFAESHPFEDLYVSPQHRILLKGNMIIAKNLVNGDTIFQDFDRESVTYYHIELERHSGIIANGVLAESYLDCGNRIAFEDLEKNSKPVKEVELIQKLRLVKLVKKPKPKSIHKIRTMIFH